MYRSILEGGSSATHSNDVPSLVSNCVNGLERVSVGRMLFIDLTSADTLGNTEFYKGEETSGIILQ